MKIMFFRFILLSFGFVSFLLGFHVSGCDNNCADNPVFTPSRLVVKYGDPTAASCSVCQRACLGNLFGFEYPVGNSTENGTTILWTVDRMSEWDTQAICYYNDDTGRQCCSTLPVTVYLPPDIVSISVVNHTGPMVEGQQYTLQCTVQDVAPVGNLIVTFYRGQTALARLQSNNNTTKEPVTEIFTLSITASNEDDGVQYWCEAELELGPEGPERPPVVMSQNITATVYYKPQLDNLSYPDTITVPFGHRLQLSCLALGNPSLSYTWTLPASLSPFNGSVLTINSVAFEDEGQYICSGTNYLGTANVLFNVDVQGYAYKYMVITMAVGVVLVLIITIILFIIFKFS